MTITMGPPSPIHGEAASKVAGKAKQSGTHAGAEASSGGFESVLACVDEEASLDPAKDSSPAASVTDGQTAQSEVPEVQNADTEREQNMLLAGAGGFAKAQSIAEMGCDPELTARDVDLSVPPNGQISYGDTLNPDAAGAIVGRGGATHTPQSRVFAAQGDGVNLLKGAFSDGAKGDVAGVDVRGNASAKLLKAVKDERANGLQGLTAVSDVTLSKTKEIALERMQVAAEEITASLDSLKTAAVEPVKRAQDFISMKQSFADVVGNAHSDGITHSSNRQTDLVAGLLPAETITAETQVSYWITGDVQKAEMTLDGLGADPVEVSISVHGKDADVSFRTDEAQTRELLEATSSKLKDLLSREGMVLTGMSVGSNGSGKPNSNGKEGHQHRGVKPIIGSVAAPVRGESGLRSVGNIGKSLDLFV